MLGKTKCRRENGRESVPVSPEVLGKMKEGFKDRRGLEKIRSY